MQDLNDMTIYGVEAGLPEVEAQISTIQMSNYSTDLATPQSSPSTQPLPRDPAMSPAECGALVSADWLAFDIMRFG